MTRRAAWTIFLIAVLATLGITGTMHGKLDIWQIIGAMLGAGAVLLYQWSTRL